MSTDSDKFVFQSALEEQDNSALFQAKRWTHVTDSSSSGGVFNSQLQFDLNTLSSMNQWTDLSQSFIEFPVKITIRGSTALTNINPFSAGIKNGFHQFVDSVQLTLGGSTIQTSQLYTNVDTSFKVLTEWSSEELRKYGPSLGIALDGFDNDVSNTGNTSYSQIPMNTLSPSLCGVSYPTNSNAGFKERLDFLNHEVVTPIAVGSPAAVSILSNMAVNGMGTVQTDAAALGANDSFVAFYLATIRLKDLCDSIAKMPPIKNLRGYLYVNYNSATSVYESTLATGVVKTNTPVNQAIFGRCQPAMISKLVTNGVADSTVTMRCEISGVPSANLPLAQPPITNARLYTPYYVASPEIDRALSQKKTIRYNERFVTTVNIGSNASTNVTVTPGISNPKRLIMLPILTGTGTNHVAPNTPLTAFQSFPELSPFDIAACGGSSPFAALQQLQVSVGNQPMFQEPVSYDAHMFLEEIAQIGRDGGLDSETGSGLLSQLMWESNYRYYTVDIGRRVAGDDGASKSIQLSANNATNAPMRLICIVWYEREVIIDTAMGTIVQGV